MSISMSLSRISDTVDKPGAGMQNFAHIKGLNTRTSASRDAIKDELSGKLHFGVAHVYNHLAIDKVPTSLVDACATSLAQDTEVQKARKRLAELAAAARAEEKEMYDPLSIIFCHIEQFVDHHVVRKFDRQMVPMNASKLKAEGDTWSFPEVSPDFTLFDITDTFPRTSTKISTTESVSENGTLPRLWRYSSGFVEVKPTEAQGPEPHRPGTVKQIVVQAADYARLHISARPFQLFSVGLLIFGSKFSVAIFDRDGVQFSPVNDMWDHMRTFIRVVRRLACDMSPVQLGQDPTVHILSDDAATPWQTRAQQMGMESFPSYSVTMGIGNHCWYTLGPPIWSSLSLLGRGTSVWRVCDASNPDKLLVLKNAWRSSNRLAESIIYQAIRGSHPGVAEYKFGADVVFPGSDRLISVNNLRKSTLSNDNASTPILHRLVIATIGRPLWDYISELELLLGIRSALKGHQFLYAQSILHRDVSAGNILLSCEKNPKPGHEGFLMDVEYAHIAQSSVSVETKMHVAPVRGPGGMMTPATTRTHTKFTPIKRGAAMTGTAQFMAYDVLDAIDKGKPISQDSHHDIESFIWVLCYSIGRRWVCNPGKIDSDRYERLCKSFHSIFGHLQLHTIMAMRSGRGGPLSIPDDYPEIVSQPLHTLFKNLRGQLHAAHAPPDIPGYPVIHLTYEKVFESLDSAIQELNSP